jgi:membrane peptidoglycan carboxypeptidase
VFGGLLGFVGLSAAAGVLVAAAVTPALAVSGMGATNTIKVFNSLPDYLAITDLMEKSTVYAYDVDGTTPIQLAQFYDQNRQEVQWDGISQFFKDAAVAKEDNRYYEHGGVDVIGTTRAVVSNAIGQDVQGGSSITQQYVKNTLIQRCVSESESVEEGEKCATAYTTSDGADGMARKLKEMRYAIGLEKEYSKDEILRGYLNIAHFGGVTYGVESASQYYFGVSAKDASLVQAATIISMVTNPNSLRIDRPDSETNGAANGYAETKKARDVTLQAMLAYGKITQQQYDEAVALPVEPNITQPEAGCDAAGGSAFFCDYVINIVRNDDTFGATQAERLNRLKRGGLDIYTTLDLEVQLAAEQAVAKNMPADPGALGNIGAASVTVEPGTGRVLAMSQSKQYSNTQTGPGFTTVNWNTDKNYGGSSGFQAGSTWKVFTLLEWLEKGHSVNETVNGVVQTFNIPNSCGGTEGWKPKNAGDGGNTGGVMSVRSATARSVNTAFAAMAEELDLCDISKMAERMGGHRADGDPLFNGPTSILGVNEVSPLSMATAYAGIANGGVVCTPIAIDKIIGPTGEELARPESTCNQAVSQPVAATAAFALQGVMNGGTGSAGNPGEGPILGKTGTTDNYRHTWLVDSSTKVTTAVWVGNVEGQTRLNRVSPNNALGSTARFRISRAIMEVAVPKYGATAFPTPDPDLTKVVTRAVPDVTGMSVEEATAALEADSFEARVADGQVPSTVGAGLVARSDPGGGANVNVGSTITLYISDGAGVTVPNVNGAKPNEARKAIEAAGFVFAADQNCSGNGPRVTTQTPGGDTVASRGSTVTIGCG